MDGKITSRTTKIRNNYHHKPREVTSKTTKVNNVVQQKNSQVWKELQKVSYKYDKNQVFCDWLDLILASLLSFSDNAKRTPDNIIEKLKQNKLDGKYEDRYMEIVKKYNDGNEKGKRAIDYLCNAWLLLVKETKETKKDILGEIYTLEITHGENGQFFTPNQITDLMVEIASPKENETVNDPCCGSGRFLISASKQNSNIKLTGTDLDERCAKMSVINMYLFNCDAEIFHGNTLTMEIYKSWKIIKGGFVFEY